MLLWNPPRVAGPDEMHTAMTAYGLSRYTAVDSVGQFDDERAAASGVLSCCTGFRIWENGSFGCPDRAWLQRAAAPARAAGMTVDHVR